MLTVSRNFFALLNRQGIRYCHWKSNKRLSEALDGQTDLDVLVHPGDREGFQAALRKCDFKPILSQPDKQFPDLEDYLGFDAETGELIHLHLHYRLILGQKYIKNHHLPIESLYFENLTSKLGVNIPCPEIELLVLIIRAHMKTDLISLGKHAIKDILGGRYTAFPKDIEDELCQLYSQSDARKFARILQESDLPLSVERCEIFLNRLINWKLRWYQILLGQHRIKRQLRPYKRRSGLGIHLTYFRHFLMSLPIARNVLSPKKKTLAGPGKVFSIVGADGSGKSTLVRDIDQWLSWKLAVTTHYYGIPKNWVSTINSMTTRVLRRMGLKSAGKYVGHLFWLYVAKHRKGVFDQTIADIGVNKIAVTDRFPLKDFREMAEPMDNPRISEFSGLMGRDMRELERSYYDDIQLPSRIFLLQVKIEELRKRKTDIKIDKHRLKADAINNVEERSPIILIDGGRPYDVVLLDLKKSIWQALDPPTSVVQ